MLLLCLRILNSPATALPICQLPDSRLPTPDSPQTDSPTLRLLQNTANLLSYSPTYLPLYSQAFVLLGLSFLVPNPPALSPPVPHHDDSVSGRMYAVSPRCPALRRCVGGMANQPNPTPDALKTHRRDQFIGILIPTYGSLWTRLTDTEWVKGLLAVPFVLYSQPHGPFDRQSLTSVAQTRDEAHRRYSEILRDVEVMIDDHSEQHSSPWVLASPFLLQLQADCSGSQSPTNTTPRTPFPPSSSSWFPQLGLSLPACPSRPPSSSRTASATSRPAVSSLPPSTTSA